MTSITTAIHLQPQRRAVMPGIINNPYTSVASSRRATMYWYSIGIQEGLGGFSFMVILFSHAAKDA